MKRSQLISPTISIITATYNALEGLKTTVASVVSQTTDDYEHIVVDGGSADGTEAWLQENSHCIRWISEPDDGIADAINKGLRIARGEWILVLHAEDTLLDETTLVAAAGALDTNAEIVSFDVIFATTTHERIWRSHGISPRINLKTTIPHQGAFCRKSLFDRVGPFDPTFKIAMDYEFFLRAYRNDAVVELGGRPIARMPDTGVSSRRDWDSLSSRFSEERAIHQLHAERRRRCVLYKAYWALYLPYRRVRYLIERAGGLGSGA